MQKISYNYTHPIPKLTTLCIKALTFSRDNNAQLTQHFYRAFTSFTDTTHTNYTEREMASEYLGSRAFSEKASLPIGEGFCDASEAYREAVIDAIKKLQRMPIDQLGELALFPDANNRYLNTVIDAKYKLLSDSTIPDKTRVQCFFDLVEFAHHPALTDTIKKLLLEKFNELFEPDQNKVSDWVGFSLPNKNLSEEIQVITDLGLLKANLMNTMSTGDGLMGGLLINRTPFVSEKLAALLPMSSISNKIDYVSINETIVLVSINNEPRLLLRIKNTFPQRIDFALPNGKTTSVDINGSKLLADVIEENILPILPTNLLQPNIQECSANISQSTFKSYVYYTFIFMTSSGKKLSFAHDTNWKEVSNSIRLDGGADTLLLPNSKGELRLNLQIKQFGAPNLASVTCKTTKAKRFLGLVEKKLGLRLYAQSYKYKEKKNVFCGEVQFESERFFLHSGSQKKLKTLQNGFIRLPINQWLSPYFCMAYPRYMQPKSFLDLLTPNHYVELRIPDFEHPSAQALYKQLKFDAYLEELAQSIILHCIFNQVSFPNEVIGLIVKFLHLIMVTKLEENLEHRDLSRELSSIDEDTFDNGTTLSKKYLSINELKSHIKKEFINPLKQDDIFYSDWIKEKLRSNIASSH